MLRMTDIKDITYLGKVQVGKQVVVMEGYLLEYVLKTLARKEDYEI